MASNRIEILVSVIIRLILLLGVVSLGSMLFIVVAMGFDSGLNLAPIVLLCAHLFTFLPAIVLTFVPFQKILKPNLFLKIWFGWVASIMGCCVMYQIYCIGYLVYYALTHESTSGKVCFFVTNREYLPTNSVMPYLENSGNGISPTRVVNPYANFKEGKFCKSYDKGLSPLNIYAYSATDENRNNWRSAESDIVSNVAVADIEIDGYTCFFVKPQEKTENNQSGWFVYSEKCNSDIDPNNFKNTMAKWLGRR